jgi:hypothetical protein
MVFVVVQEPSGDLPECGDRIRKRVHANIVSLEGFDEAARGWPREFSAWISALRGRDVLDGISAQAGPPRPAWRQAGDLGCPRKCAGRPCRVLRTTCRTRHQTNRGGFYLELNPKARAPTTVVLHLEHFLRRGSIGSVPRKGAIHPSSGRDVHFMARPPPRSVRAAFPHTAPASGV